MRLLIIEKPEMTPVSWWRCFMPLQMMRRLDPNFEFEITEKFSDGDLTRFDALLLFRPSYPVEMSAIATAKKMGLKVIVDYDDDFQNVPEFSPVFGKIMEPERQNVVRAVAATADMVWTTTEAISTAMQRPDAHVIPNAVPETWIPKKPAQNTKSASWRGREMQYMDVVFQGIVSGWYNQIATLPEVWTWMGWMPFPRAEGPKHVFREYGNITQYIDYVRNAGINVLWKPLVECQFNDAKSNISWIEATIGGGVCVTNYAGKKWWEHALPDFTFDDKVLRETWEVSAQSVYERHNLKAAARQRLTLLKQLMK